MPRIFDNIENFLTKGLSDSLKVSHRADFCVGYFNLRGWKEVADKIDLFSGKLFCKKYSWIAVKIICLG